MAESFSENKRVAIVTGAGKGIGRACAIGLAREGMIVIVNNRSHAGDQEHSADKVVNEIVAAGGHAIANYQSIENADSGANLVDLALNQFGHLDVVISNAGISLNQKVEDTSEAQLREVMEVNFFAAVALTQAALPTLKESLSGRLIHCISSAGLYGGYGMGAYSASKAALWAYLKTCALEYADHGVCVNAVAPFADTQMTKGFMTEKAQRELTPEAVAPVLLWLASQRCDVNGETFITAGGRLRAARVAETCTASFTNPQAVGDIANQILKRPHELHFKSGVEAFNDICE